MTNEQTGRPWLIEARARHSLTRDEAAILAGRKRLKGPALERAIAERLARQGISQPDLSLLLHEVCGVAISQNEISKIETGDRQRMKPSYVEALAKILRMTRDEVVYGGARPRIVRILGKMLEDETIRVYPEEERLDLGGWPVPPDTVAYRIATDSLEPRYRQGDLIFCLEQGAEIGECIGEECVVEIDGQRYVGLIEAGASARVITLRPFRASNPTLVDRTPSWLSPINWIHRPRKLAGSVSAA